MIMKTEIKNTRRLGRGVYATRNIKKGDVVEISPVIVVDNSSFLNSTILNTYVFEWRRGSSVLALGVGSLFNHSKKSNVTYNPVFQENTIIFVARKNIKKGYQLFIDYGYDPKHGIDTTEKNMYRALKEKYEPELEKPMGKDRHFVAYPDKELGYPTPLEKEKKQGS